jgi:hypothetical protein
MWELDKCQNPSPLLKNEKPVYAWPTELLCKLQKLKEGEIAYVNDSPYAELGDPDPVPYYSAISLHYYLISFGKDNKGVYMSIYDQWDFEANGGSYKSPKKLLWKMEQKAMAAIGKPIHIYDRYYIPEKDIKNELERRAHEKIAKDK